MKLKSLETVNFRGLPDNVPFRFDGGNFTVVYGQNEAGKSSILEAISLGLFAKTNREHPAFQRWDSPHAPIIKIAVTDAKGHEYRITRNYQERRSYLVGPGIELSQESAIANKVNEWWGGSDLFRKLLIVSQKELEFKDGKALNAQIEALASGTEGGKPVAHIAQSIESRLAVRGRPFKGKDGALFDSIVQELAEANGKLRQLEDSLRKASSDRGTLADLQEQYGHADRELDEIARVLEWTEAFVPSRKALTVINKVTELSIHKGTFDEAIGELTEKIDKLNLDLGILRKAHSTREQINALTKTVEKDKRWIADVEELQRSITDADKAIDGPEISERDKASIDRCYTQMAGAKRSLEQQKLTLIVDPKTALTVTVRIEECTIEAKTAFNLAGYENEITVAGVAELLLRNEGLSSLQQDLEKYLVQLKGLQNRLGFTDQATVETRYRACRQKNSLLTQLKGLRGGRDIEQTRIEVGENEAKIKHLESLIALAAGDSRDLTQEEQRLQDLRTEKESMGKKLLNSEKQIAAYLNNQTLEYWEKARDEALTRLAGCRAAESLASVQAIKALANDLPELESTLRNLQQTKQSGAASLTTLAGEIQVLQERLRHVPSYEDMAEWIEKKDRLEKQKGRAETHHEVLLKIKATLLAAYENVKSGLAQAIEDEGSNIFALLTDRRYPGIKVDIRDIELSVIDSTGVVRPVQERDFSEGTLQQLYLSVRIAVAKTLLQTDDLPLVIDDALVDFDDHRFDRAMDIFARLAQTGQQVILFTCHQRYSQHNPGYTALTL